MPNWKAYNYGVFTQMKNVIPRNDSTHQDLWQEIQSYKIWCQIKEILLFQKNVYLIPTDMNQFWRLDFHNNKSRKSINAIGGQNAEVKYRCIIIEQLSDSEEEDSQICD